MAGEVGMAIAPMIIEPLMKRVICNVLYAFNFNKIVEELKQETSELKMTHDRVTHDVNRGKSNAEEIEKDVETWLMEAERITVEVGRLEEDISKKRSCVNGLCPNLLERYRLGKQAMKKKDAMIKLRGKGNFSRVSYFPDDHLPGIEFYENKDFMPSASTKSAFNMIMKELKDDKTKIIALYGMGGVGKTTLAAEVGKKAKELKLVDVVVMAVVSQNPSIEGIQGQIADMIGLHFQESSSVGKANRLRLRLENMEKKVLIVLDDLWQKLDLASIGIPSGDDCMNCKVFLTTRRQQVCNSMGSQCNIPLDVLTDEEACALFNKCGGISNDSSLASVAKSMANECQGLPLAIVTVASALKGRSPREWEVALRRLKRSQYEGSPDADKNVYKCIRFSYDYLEGEETKLCFLLCSLFPEDHNIEVEVLVRYAYGLGLCQDVGDSIDNVRSELHVVITSLKDSSLLLSGCDKYGSESNEFVQMHDIVRDVAVWISSKDERNVSMVKAGIGLEEWPRGIPYQSLIRISLMENNIAEHCSGLVCPRLNLLLLDANGCYEFPNDFYDGMKELQVLSVCDTRSRTPDSSPILSLPKSIQHLTNLRTLRIERILSNDISVLGKLKGLEILSLRGSHLEELPSAIGELNGLIVLDLSDCYRSMRIPDKLLRKLSKLEELYIEIPGRDEESCYAFLCDLMSLPKLSLLSLKIDNIQCLREGICFPKHLKRYCIRFGSWQTDLLTLERGSKDLMLENIDVPKLNAFKEIIPGVNTLWLTNIEDECIPNIMPTIDQSGLHDLTYLFLEDCHNMECLLNTNGWKTKATALPKLESIHLSGMDSLTELICGLPTDGLFQELEKLQVRVCNKLSTLFPEKLSRRMPNLKEVTVEECDKVKILFELDLVSTYLKENELLLSNLETLQLSCLPELTRIWKGPIEVVSLVNLRELTVYRCPKLTSLSLLSVGGCLVQLQVLRISECRELKQIFYAQERQEIGHEPTEWFPQLRELSLAKLPKFISFWHESYIPTLPVMPYLKKLLAEGCPNMGTQFIAAVRVFEKKLEVFKVEGAKWSSSCNTVLEQLSFTNGSRISLQQLSITNIEGLRPLIPGLVRVERELTIIGCKGVEQILEVGGQHSLQSTVSWNRLTLEEVADLTCIWRGPSQILIFHNLSLLKVVRCHGLKKHLLTTSIAQSLLQLYILVVEDCKELEQIFGDDETDERIEIVTLPLRTLKLILLPNLISFCPSTYHFIFPSLPIGALYVHECPNNHTAFSRETNTQGRTTAVHAKGEALCSTQIRGICNDISGGSIDLPLLENSSEPARVRSVSMDW